MKLNSEKFAFIFPGQGSQVVGMGQDLANKFSICKEIFDQANNIINFDLSRVMWEGPEEELNDTINTQPALFVHSIAALKLLELEFPNIKATYLAGHSMGEISALVCAGAISFENGLKLVRKRGEAMKQAGRVNPGGMAAVLGMDVKALADICKQVSTETNPVQVANDNCPGQIVISGERSALEKAMELAKANGARRIRPLSVSIAAHSKLMTGAQDDFNKAIKEIYQFNLASIPIISNVKAIPIKSAVDLKEDILSQLTERVRWTESINFIHSMGVNNFIEIGSGNVLTGLLKRINEECTGFPFGDLSNLEALTQAMEVPSRM
jgi:[acyl-carrier-protein] S-malonyltransferase